MAVLRGYLLQVFWGKFFIYKGGFLGHCMQARWSVMDSGCRPFYLLYIIISYNRPSWQTMDINNSAKGVS